MNSARSFAGGGSSGPDASKADRYTTQSKTASFTAAPGFVYLVDSTSGAVTITLPAASTAGQTFAVKWVAGTNPAVLNRAGSDTIGASATTATMGLLNEIWEFLSSGAGQWNLIGGNKTLSSLDARYIRPIGRWVAPYYTGVATTSAAFTAGRVILAMFELRDDRTIDGIAYVVGATSNGNVRAGIVGPIGLTADAATGAAVVVQSASVAQGSINAPQFITLAPTLCKAGLYYVALESDSATGTYMRQSNQQQAVGLACSYDRSGGYGALIDPTPTTVEMGSNVPGFRIRLA